MIGDMSWLKRKKRDVVMTELEQLLEEVKKVRFAIYKFLPKSSIKIYVSFDFMLKIKANSNEFNYFSYSKDKVTFAGYEVIAATQKEDYLVTLILN